MTIVFAKEVKFYLDNLIEILVSQDYFGFKSTAKVYVDDIFNYIENKIALPSKLAPLKFQK
jgi:hypothetical protein